MKIDTMEDGTIRVKQLYNSIVLETNNGQRMAVCFRDNGIEFGVSESYHNDDYVWFQAEKGKVIREGKQVPNRNTDFGSYCSAPVENFPDIGFSDCGEPAYVMVDGKPRCKLHGRDKNGLDHAFMKSLREGEHLKDMGLSDKQIESVRQHGETLTFKEFKNSGEQNES